MKAKATLIYLLLPLLLISDNRGIDTSTFVGECTIGIFMGQATSDGRPILWKNRDVTNAVQKFCYYSPMIYGDDTTLAFTANAYSNDTTRVYMGLNAAGFAIMNANTYNLNDYLSDGIDDGAIMRMALQSCRTLEDFERVLDITSMLGRKDCWNFGAIDGAGQGAIYECANHSYTRFDAIDSLMEGGSYILRATFSFSGGDSLDGFSRYKRATHLVRQRLRVQPVDVQFVLQTLSRDLANPFDDPYPLPYDGSQNGRPAGFILARNVTINRDISRSVVVIQGVAPGEDPALATIFGIIGPPVLSVAYPLWVRAECVPPALHDGTEVPMYGQVMRRHSLLYSLTGDDDYLDSRYLMGKNGVGLFTYTMPLETSTLNSAENYVSIWRQEIPNREVFANVQNTLAESIFANYQSIPLYFNQSMASEQSDGITVANYPNPFNVTTTIFLSGIGAGEPVNLSIYNMLGQRVREFESVGGQGNYVVWDGCSSDGTGLASGVYFANAVSGSRSSTSKMILMK